MIYTKKQPGSEMAEMALGGIRIYGEQEEMRASIAAVTDAIDAAFEEQLCMTKPGFKKSICSKIVAENPERIFSGVFGRMISEGRIQIAECRAENGSIYRSYFRTPTVTRSKRRYQRLWKKSANPRSVRYPSWRSAFSAAARGELGARPRSSSAFSRDRESYTSSADSK